jgi:hypothetical protein
VRSSTSTPSSGCPSPTRRSCATARSGSIRSATTSLAGRSWWSGCAARPGPPGGPAAREQRARRRAGGAPRRAGDVRRQRTPRRSRRALPELLSVDRRRDRPPGARGRGRVRGAVRRRQYGAPARDHRRSGHHRDLVHAVLSSAPEQILRYLAADEKYTVSLEEFGHRPAGWASLAPSQVLTTRSGQSARQPRMCKRRIEPWGSARYGGARRGHGPRDCRFRTSPPVLLK